MPSIKQALSALMKDGSICTRAHKDVMPGSQQSRDEAVEHEFEQRAVIRKPTAFEKSKPVAMPKSEVAVRKTAAYTNGRSYTFAARDAAQALVKVVIRAGGRRRRTSLAPVAVKLVPM